MLFGNPKYNIVPAVEDIKHGIDLYAVTTSIGACLLVGYTVAADKIAGTRPLLRSSIILSGVLLLSFLLFCVAGVAL